MVKKGISFFVPVNKSNTIELFHNFDRSDGLILRDNEIRFDDLNKSDYLYQTIILFILKKIDSCETNNVKNLYSLISDIENLQDNIYVTENNKEVDYEASNIEILLRSQVIADRCLEERIFDYE